MCGKLKFEKLDSKYFTTTENYNENNMNLKSASVSLHAWTTIGHVEEDYEKRNSAQRLIMHILG